MKDQQKLERYQRWYAVFNNPQGESVLKDIAKMCNYEETLIFVDSTGKVDGLAMAVHIGKRALFTEIKRNLVEPVDMPESVEDEDN